MDNPVYLDGILHDLISDANCPNCGVAIQLKQKDSMYTPSAACTHCGMFVAMPDYLRGDKTLVAFRILQEE